MCSGPSSGQLSTRTKEMNEIYLAEIFSKLGAELEKNFGLALFSLRKKYLPAEQAVALEGRLHPVTVRSRAKLAA